MAPGHLNGELEHAAPAAAAGAAYAAALPGGTGAPAAMGSLVAEAVSGLGPRRKDVSNRGRSVMPTRTHTKKGQEAGVGGKGER